MLQFILSRSSGLRFLSVSWTTLALVGACATIPEEQDWIKVGRTTKAEVLEQYGQPDLVLPSGDGETAVYRPRDPKQLAPQMEVPTMQPGPLGTATTRMEPVSPGLGSKPANSGRRSRPVQELRIRYDAQGIVQELIR